MRTTADFFSEMCGGLRLISLADGYGGLSAGADIPGYQAMARAGEDRSGSYGGGGEKGTNPAAGRGGPRAVTGRFGGAEPEPATDLDSGSDFDADSSLGSVPDSDAQIVGQAQQNEGDGVEEDMATLVLDNPALGVRRGLPESVPEVSSELHAAGSAAADPASDAAIMLRAAAGDEASFNFLVQKYHRAMINFLYRMVHNQAVAEELAQEVFLRVYRSRETYRAEAKFTTWLYRIATNLAVNHARDTKHERSAQSVYLDVPDEETGTTPEVADDRPTAEQNLLRDERMAAIRMHVMALPERQKTAVLMHKYQGMDYRQIGEVLKLSESATKSLLFRAYQSLREKLKDFV